MEGAMPHPLPEFLGIGVQKGGTTTLQRLLERHPQVWLPPEKEVHFFSRHYARGSQWYADRFAAARPDQHCGEITPYYDSMIAKLIVASSDREGALAKLRSVLDQSLIGPLRTNTGLHRWLADQPDVVDATMTTRFLDENPPPSPPPFLESRDIAGALVRDAAESDVGPWGRLPSFRSTLHTRRFDTILRDGDGELHEFAAAASAEDRIGVYDAETGVVAVNTDGHTLSYEAVDRIDAWAPDAGSAGGAAGDVVAPFPAVVVETPVSPGQHVAAGDTVIVVEAMKMLHSLTAPGPGGVDEIRVGVGDAVEQNQTLVTFVTAPDTPSPEQDRENQ